MLRPIKHRHDRQLFGKLAVSKLQEPCPAEGEGDGLCTENREQLNEKVSQGCLAQEEVNQVTALVREHEATNGMGYGSMRVNELRYRMAGRGLAADGSKTTMIKDLRDSDAQVGDLSQG